MIRPRLAPFVHVALLLALVGCRRSNDPSGVSDSAFVAAMEKLYTIDRDSLLDSAAKAAARRTALQERGLSQERIEQKARSLADQPDHALQLMSRVDSGVRGLRRMAPMRPPRIKGGAAKQELQPAPPPASPPRR